jgi:CheY-like chemotaxis protein
MQNYTRIAKTDQRLEVLVVDDLEATRMIVKTALDHAGYAVSGATSGEEAIAYLQGHPDPLTIHAITCDLKMPGMGGLDTVRYIRTHYPWINVIVLTAHPNMTVAYHLLKLGISGYLLKPFTHARLLEVVDRCVYHAGYNVEGSDWTTSHPRDQKEGVMAAKIA